MTDDQLSAVERIVLQGLRRADPDAASALASLGQAAQRRVLTQFNDPTTDDSPTPAALGHAAGNPQQPQPAPTEQLQQLKPSAQQSSHPPTLDATQPAEQPQMPPTGPANEDSATRGRRPLRWAIAASALVAVAVITAIAYTVYNNDAPGSSASDSARIAAGGGHSCGIRTDATLTCWGSNDSRGNHAGQADPPPGQFTAVSAGLVHSCGIRTDATLTCWGSNTDDDGNHTGQTDPPHGQFTAVSAGAVHSCGIRTDGTLTCWGSNDWDSNHAGQARPAPRTIHSSLRRRRAFMRHSHRRHTHMLGQQHG